MFSILGLIPTILTFFTGLGGTASKISADLRDREVAREKTKSDKELKQIDAEIAVLHDRKDVLVAEAGQRINSIIRAGIAIGPMAYVLKYFAFDKVLGSIVGCSINPLQWHCGIFRTDPLNAEMTIVLSACLGFYFLHSAIRGK